MLLDITNTISQTQKRPNGLSGAPLSPLAVLSSHPGAVNPNVQQVLHPNDLISMQDFLDYQNYDAVSVVQTSKPSAVSFKNEPIGLQQAIQMQAIQQGLDHMIMYQMNQLILEMMNQMAIHLVTPQ